MIVIPMAGISRRFTEAGYTLPKYMLPARGRTVFAHAAGSFARYNSSVRFLFIVRDVAGTADFVRAECRTLGIRHADIVVLDQATRGQAETVALGLQRAGAADGEAVTIFNIDTFRPGFTFPDFAGLPTDGYLEVFRGSGANWSYVRPTADDSDLVGETAEKRPISDLCCTGLYHFASAELFHEAYRMLAHGFAPSPAMRELYVAPLYNGLIAHGRVIRYHLIPREAVTFCGVPAEYEAFLRSG